VLQVEAAMVVTASGRSGLPPWSSLGGLHAFVVGSYTHSAKAVCCCEDKVVSIILCPAGLTHLALEQQEEEAWLPPPELLHTSRLRSLSIRGNDCS
jgi:hypothetical protein